MFSGVSLCEVANFVSIILVVVVVAVVVISLSLFCRYMNTQCVPERKTPISMRQLCHLTLTDFENSSTGRLISKFVVDWLLTIPPYLKCVTTLPCDFCELFLSRSRQTQEPSEANSLETLGRSKLVVKHLYSDVGRRIICFIDKNDIRNRRTEKSTKPSDPEQSRGKTS